MGEVGIGIGFRHIAVVEVKNQDPPLATGHGTTIWHIVAKNKHDHGISSLTRSVLDMNSWVSR